MATIYSQAERNSLAFKSDPAKTPFENVKSYLSCLNDDAPLKEILNVHVFPFMKYSYNRKDGSLDTEFLYEQRIHGSDFQSIESTLYRTVCMFGPELGKKEAKELISKAVSVLSESRTVKNAPNERSRMFLLNSYEFHLQDKLGVTRF